MNVTAWIAAAVVLVVLDRASLRIVPLPSSAAARARRLARVAANRRDVRWRLIAVLVAAVVWWVVLA